MTQHDAIALIRDAVPLDAPVWADLGAGSGTFTRALATLIGNAGVVHAVERDPKAVRELARLSVAQERLGGARISAEAGDFTLPLALDALDGILLANALHFVPYEEQAPLLRRLLGALTPSGRMVLVEYDRARGTPWVPYPIPVRSFASLAAAAGLHQPTFSARMSSAFGGDIYCAWSTPA